MLMPWPLSHSSDATTMPIVMSPHPRHHPPNHSNHRQQSSNRKYDLHPLEVKVPLHTSRLSLQVKMLCNVRRGRRLSKPPTRRLPIDQAVGQEAEKTATRLQGHGETAARKRKKKKRKTRTWTRTASPSRPVTTGQCRTLHPQLINARNTLRHVAPRLLLVVMPRLINPIRGLPGTCRLCQLPADKVCRSYYLIACRFSFFDLSLRS
jgi:hypothetical protein